MLSDVNESAFEHFEGGLESLRNHIEARRQRAQDLLYPMNVSVNDNIRPEDYSSSEGFTESPSSCDTSTLTCNTTGCPHCRVAVNDEAELPTLQDVKREVDEIFTIFVELSARLADLSLSLERVKESSPADLQSECKYINARLATNIDKKQIMSISPELTLCADDLLTL